MPARRDRATLNKEAGNRFRAPPVALAIAGSDCSSGAGIQADLKTFTALGVYGLTAVTCVVAEIPGKVSRIEVASSKIVRDQIKVLLKNFQVGAIKTGLLCSEEIVCAVAEVLQGSGLHIPFVIDPVMIATSGDRLLEAAATAAYKNKLFPLATLITPNLDEAGLLLGTRIKDRKEMEEAAETLAKQFGCAILLKGGHFRGRNAVDLLFHRGRLTDFSAPFVRDVATHGTGCTYSAAITAGLASRLSLEKAIARAKRFVTKAVAQHFRWKRDSGEVDALNHRT
ncbi:MAG: bifunctional hydroxymethylpyrimidine kinase/phosphomethylpyrimidine kinase [Alphaproteobacteria bacterium]